MEEAASPLPLAPEMSLLHPGDAAFIAGQQEIPDKQKAVQKKTLKKITALKLTGF